MKVKKKEKRVKSDKVMKEKSKKVRDAGGENGRLLKEKGRRR